jgi:hypothetical protein
MDLPGNAKYARRTALSSVPGLPVPLPSHLLLLSDAGFRRIRIILIFRDEVAALESDGQFSHPCIQMTIEQSIPLDMGSHRFRISAMTAGCGEILVSQQTGHVGLDTLRLY